MRILLTNDDGIYSEGLRILREALEAVGEVYVIAPEGERSAISHAISLKRPVRCWQISERVWASDGTPVDCIHLALHFLETPPDLVISGPNNGPNMGEEVFYSGTVAAALEAGILGMQAMAISVVARRNHLYDTAAYVALRIAERMMRDPLPPRTVLNVNVPNLPKEFLKGFKVTRLGRRIFNNSIVEQMDPRGARYYWVGGGEPRFLEREGTDVYAVSRGLVSITPLRADLTAYEELEKMIGWEVL
ncbi:MAG: 5'/3'-nucleotidase SurE [Deltaproteobacteria bacterium]|nr:MAG: 5'/3'-nucleotidase SurE [Deltaproteobacteria bacterium]